MRIKSPLIAVFFFVFLTSCGEHSLDNEPARAVPEVIDKELTIQFLTRDGCKNTRKMLARLKDALGRLDQRVDLEIVHQAGLRQDDPRIGYPTPTLLIDGKDIFGSPVPTPPFPAPS